MAGGLSAYKKMISDNGFHGKEAFFVFCDLVHCRIKYHFMPEEYFFYGCQFRRDRERKNFLVRYHQRTKYCLVNSGKDYAFTQKTEQYKFFPEFIGRKWIAVDESSIEELEEFINRHGRVIFKPSGGSQGKGIFAFFASEIPEKLIETYGEIHGNNYLCEEFILQHPKMAELCPTSVNTVRIITFNDGNSAEIVAAGLRTGGSSGICDNMSIGGIGASVDIETGVVYTCGYDFKRRCYVNHPISDTQIVGFNIPFWEEAKEKVLSAANRVSEISVIGWDVAFLENGVCLVEFNTAPGMRLVQLTSGKPAGKRILDYIEKNTNGKKLSKAEKENLKKYR